MNELISLFPADTTIIVVSDHGAKRLVGGICFNEWLIEQGYLSLEFYPQEVMPIDKVSIDWSKTRAWGDGGYYGRLFLNVQGREPQGIIPPEDYEDVRQDLISKIEVIEDDKGRNIGSRAYRPEDLYKECNGIPPDLIVYFGDLEWRPVGSVGLRSIHTFENDLGPDDANHDWHGIFIISGKNMGNIYLDTLDIYKINPLILELMGA
jgi:predicted AlkP superfamily phosphohydrolase/phosphomutase